MRLLPIAAAAETLQFTWEELFVAFVALLAFLAFGLDGETLLLIAMAVVTAIRITAYYSEDLSRDLAKMLPLALLGVVILEGTAAISFTDSLALVRNFGGHWRRVASYLLFLVPLELGLRMVRVLATGRLSTVRVGVPSPDVDPIDDGDAQD